MRVIFVCFAAFVIFHIHTNGEASSFSNEEIAQAIQNNVPEGWKIVEKRENKLPRGHYWGLEYEGRTGQEITLQGPKM
jgi:hypothetical protein